MTHTKNQYLQLLSLWVAVVPLVTINISYLMAVATEHLPACIPYLSGCTSVSATGRVAPESLIFKTGMLLSAVALPLLWHRSATFLQTGGKRPSRVFLLRVFSLLAALSLTLYAVTLGIKGDDFRLLRRIGIDGFAFSNLITEVLFIVLYRPTDADRDDAETLLLVGRFLYRIAAARHRRGTGKVAGRATAPDQ